jgi:IS30 family transposase
VPEVVKVLGKDRTTIWREIKENSGKTGYHASSAIKRAQQREVLAEKGKEN